MRVTANTFPNALVNQLSALTIRQNRLQNQVATGQRVQFPEDDPAAMRRVLDLQAESGAVSQYQRNIAWLQELADVSYAQMKGLKKLSDRAGEIATLADGTRPQDELTIFANEINGIIKQAVQAANAQHRGNYLFSGTTSNVSPFAMTTDADGKVTAVTYQGNTSVKA
jgi:flagellar hook-associated protein 3 FlgL